MVSLTKVLKWIEVWLTYRTEQVMLDGVSSAPAPVKPTLPHGTVLEFIIFLIYNNDIVNNISLSLHIPRNQ